MKITVLRISICLAVCSLLLIALTALAEAGKPPPPPPPPADPKLVSFSIREDYDKNHDLGDIALDLALLNQLDIDMIEVTFGWDDYNPAPGVYDWTWLHSYVNLVAQYGIQMQVDINYTPEWAGDGMWNSPPNDWNDWYNFCYYLGIEMASHPNIHSWEIWGEPNSTIWWNGTWEEYKTLLMLASNAFKATNPNWPIIWGTSWPYYEFVDTMTLGDFEQYYEIQGFCCYEETWTGPQAPVEDYLDRQYTDFYVPTINNNGAGEPIWMMECGYSTMERTELDQANWHARAVPYLLASDASLNEIEHYTIYEIKDLDPGQGAIGDEHNYFLGICYTNRTPKLAFYTLDMLTDLLDGRAIIPANSEVTSTATSGRFGDKYQYLIKRVEPGGGHSQLFFIYDKTKTVTCSATLTTPGTTCTKWNLDGTSTDWSANFNGTTISNVQLTPGNVAIFEIMP